MMADRDTGNGNPGRAVNVRPRLRFWALTALLIAGVILLNTVAALLGARFPLTADLTAGAVFRLEGDTEAFIGGLEKDVEIYVLALPDDFLAQNYLIQAQRIIEQFPRFSDRITLEYVDYTNDPTFKSRFPGVTLETGNILVVSGDRLKIITLSELFNFSYTDSAGNVAVTSSRAEEAVTSAIINVTTDSQVKVAFITGNGAAGMYGRSDDGQDFVRALPKVLADNNYLVTEINLTSGALDTSFDLAVLLSPQQDYTEAEMSKLDDFLYNEGRYGKTLLYAAGVDQPPLPNIEAFLREWGAAVDDGTVFETDSSKTVQNNPYSAIPDYADTHYRDMLFDASNKLLMPLSRPLKRLFETRDDNYVTVLLTFGETAGVRPSDAPEEFPASDATVWGPMPAMMLLEKRILENGVTAAKSNVIVTASTEMFGETYFYSTVLNNSEYILNLLGELSGRDDAVSIRPKSMIGEGFSVTSSFALTLGIIMFAVIPLLIIGSGIAVWLRRRFS